MENKTPDQPGYKYARLEKEPTREDVIEHLKKGEAARLVSHQQEKVSDVSKLLGEDHIPQVIKFLLGAGTLDGLWWHEKPTDGRSPFWWRKHLLELYSKEPEEYNTQKEQLKHLRELYNKPSKQV